MNVDVRRRLALHDLESRGVSRLKRLEGRGAAGTAVFVVAVYRIDVKICIRVDIIDQIKELRCLRVLLDLLGQRLENVVKRCLLSDEGGTRRNVSHNGFPVA